MSTYTQNWFNRYELPSLQQQIEVAVVTAAMQILEEDPATDDHANRLKWAQWALSNPSAAWPDFGWVVSMNDAINEAIVSAVKDSDVQFVVNSNLPTIVNQRYGSPKPPETL